MSKIHEFRVPLPVIVENDDAWCVVHCQGGIVRHYRSDQIRVYINATFDIVK